MQKYSGHIPDAPRQLPAVLYGQFDIRTTPDGGRQYSLPHTLGASVIARTTQPRVLLAIGVSVCCSGGLAVQKQICLASFCFVANEFFQRFRV